MAVTLPPVPPVTPSPAGGPARRPGAIGDPIGDWRLSHRLAFLACWAAGITVCVAAAAIILYMAFRGAQYLSLDMFFSRPQPGIVQSQTGGILDPIIGTVLLTIIGILIATPLGVVAAIWIVEYGRPFWLARAIESGIEVVAGTPDIVLAIFGLAIFQLPFTAPLSFTADEGGVFGRSFFAAGAMISLIALPLIFSSTREGLLQIPAQMREASWALGKTRICTIREVLLPNVRRHIATGATLGMGRMVGDTAIVVVLLGGSLQLETVGDIPGLDVLKGTGSTLTTYIYNASPAGEGNAPEKAYAAAFVLLLIVLALNGVAAWFGRRNPSLEATR